MPPQLMRITNFLTWVTCGAVAATLFSLSLQKYTEPGRVLTADDLAAVCQSVPGCKRIAATRAFRPESRHATVKITIVADKRTHLLDVRDKVMASLDHQWHEKAGRFAPDWHARFVEVRHD